LIFGAPLDILLTWDGAIPTKKFFRPFWEVFLEKPGVWGENPRSSSSRWEKPGFQLMSYKFVGSRFPR
jgi:hypothetical protein